VRALITDGLVSAVHDISDGGLAIAVAEMALASGIGAAIEPAAGSDQAAAFFGEDQGRYVLTAPADREELLRERAEQAGVSLVRIGMTEGTALVLGDARPIALSELHDAHEGWFPGFMGEG
jgi:phosphoribosylformylglycinamidine synthase